MEHNGSLQCSQKPDSLPYSKPDVSSPQLTTLYFTKIHSNIIFKSTPTSSVWFPDQNSAHVSYLYHACYISRPSHSPWLDHANNTWWCVQVMKLIIIQSSSAPLH